MQRCKEAAAAADHLRQHANAAGGGEEAGRVMQQLISHMVTEQDKQRQTQAKACFFFTACHAVILLCEMA